MTYRIKMLRAAFSRRLGKISGRGYGVKTIFVNL